MATNRHRNSRCRIRPLRGWSATRNVWSAALSQAKSESDRLVCANVFGLCWSGSLLAMMECAALFSHLVKQSWKTSSEFGFGERRVRPLCHLVVSPADLAGNHKFLSSRWAVDVGIEHTISKPGFGQASSAGQSGRSVTGQHRRSIDFTFSEYSPCDARQLVRQRHAHNVVVSARGKLRQPRPQTGRLLLSKLQDGACALYE